mmetsp:Transcript_15003/g.41506  ORF Transcript_15003/g.41506 Transcript_15003/m.41506 type:complete len:217 (-) Transcript_15003:89-739(-)
MNGIFQFHIFVPPLFQKVLGRHVILPNRRGLPAKVGAGRVHLIQAGRAVALQARHEERNAKGTHATPLRIFLHRPRRILDQLTHGLRFAVHACVRLCRFASAFDQHSIIRPDAGVTKARGGRDFFNLVHLFGIDQNAGHFFIRRQDHSVHGTNAQRRFAIGHGVQGVLDLEQFARSRKGGQTKTVRRVAHGDDVFVMYYCSGNGMLLLCGRVDVEP